MAQKIIMPKQGLQMTSGVITQWLVSEGDPIQEGQPLFEMETDKLTITIDSSATGTVLKILSEPGESVPITQTIAIVGEPGEDISALLPQSASEGSKPDEKAEDVSRQADDVPRMEKKESIFATPRARMRAQECMCDLNHIEGSGPEGLIIERDVLDRSIPKASPLARKEAEIRGVDLSSVEGSGVNGKIMAADVRAISATSKSQPSEATADTVLPIRGMRKIIAQRMHDSLTELAQANHRMEVDMSEAVRLRERFKAKGIKVSYNDIIIRCTAVALTEFPMLNASIVGENIHLKHDIHIGMAVATEEGLLVPVLRNANQMTLAEIANRTKDLAARTKENKLSPDEIRGGTFTVTNLGMYDVDCFTAIINAPEAGILAVGALKKRPVVLDDDHIVVRPMLWLSLTYDHRIIDGAPAAQFLRRIKALLEDPVLML